MKKNLSKKISLLLCGTFLLANIMGSGFVYANPNKPTCPDAPKKPAAGSRVDPTESTDVQQTQRNFQDKLDEEGKVIELEIRFSDIFKELCEKFNIKKEEYNEFSNSREVLSAMDSEEDLFRHESFNALRTWARDWNNPESSPELIPVINSWLDGLVKYYGLHS